MTYQQYFLTRLMYIILYFQEISHLLEFQETGGNDVEN